VREEERPRANAYPIYFVDCPNCGREEMRILRRPELATVMTCSDCTTDFDIDWGDV